MDVMKKKMFVIPFKGLKEENHQFEFQIKKEFFEFYQYDDVCDADILVQLDFNKKSTFIELSFNAEGTAKVLCDLTNELYQQPIKAKLDLVIKFGEVFKSVKRSTIRAYYTKRWANDYYCRCRFWKNQSFDL